LSSFKTKHNKKGEIISLDDLRKYIEENQLRISNLTEVFVCDAMVGDGKVSLICIVFTPKTCLRFLDKMYSTSIPMISVDGTFKVNNIGYLMLYLTTQDARHQMFPIAFAPTSSGSEETISLC